MRRVLLVLMVLATGLVGQSVRAEAPLPEPNFAATVTPRQCVADAGNEYEMRQYNLEGWRTTNYVRYPGACQRLKFAFGPIHVKPGQNDVLIEPVTIQKPTQDGYIVRFKPDLVRADGSVPPIEQVHLHHGTWIMLTGSGEYLNSSARWPDGFFNDTFGNYGSGPFFASGEEKTIGSMPRGYGMPIKATDNWQLLYMVHNLTENVDEVWITYDVDFIPVAKAASIKPAGIKPAYPVWLDVRRGSSYPVFNVQRGFPTDGATTCTWPKQQCAAFDPWGKVSLGQGDDGNGTGTDWTFPEAGKSLGRLPNFQGGTIIGMGGHVHPGGLSTDIELVRNGEAKTILTSEAIYWDWDQPDQPGGPPTSWDLSMTAVSAPRWGIKVKPGDALRINATYDAAIQSSYENMGIAVAFVTPDPETPGVDPFDTLTEHDPAGACSASGRGLLDNPHALCTKGSPTHGHMFEADNKGGEQNTAFSFSRMSNPTGQVAIADFKYLPGDLATANSVGIPVVGSGQDIRFINFDMAANIYHTVTSCAYPCSGATGIAFPLADGASDQGSRVDFDSAELGFSPQFGPAKNEIDWTLTVDANQFRSGELYTYFCRIHPSMRGAFVVE